MNKYKQFSKTNEYNRNVVTCKNKQRFFVLEFAQKMAKQQEEQYGHKMYVYYCFSCNGYHTTKTPPDE